MSKQLRVAIILCALAMFSVLISACGGDTGGATSAASPSAATQPAGGATASCATGTIQATGSTALQPLVKAVAADYQKKCSGANITIGGGGSGTGLKNAQDGSSTIGDSDIFADKTKYPDLTDNQVAVVVFSVVINSKVTGVTNLTSAQLKDIYTGKAKNWKELGGPDLAIVPVSRPTGSGTRVTFETFILGGKESITGNPVANSSGEVANTVNQTDGAVSYVASDFAKKNNLTVIKVDGNDDSDTNVQSNTYKFWNLEHMYTKGPASGLALAFINYVKGPDAAATRQQQGFLDISKMSQDAITAKTPKA
ncbi:MAG: phosphate ABC transporter substrate-binding protein [Ktedonobacteraceae bacterium]